MSDTNGGPVDQYLDRLFDLLTGTGRAGRRTLAEAETHLLDSAEALRRAGQDPVDAEREAVARFGSPERLAAQVARAQPLPARTVLGRLIAAAWVIGGVGSVAIGISGVFDQLIGSAYGRDLIAPDPPGATYTAARCADLLAAYPQATDCRAASIAHHAEELVYRPLAVGLLGLLVLLAFAVARRSRRLRGLTTLPPLPVVAAAGTAVFGAAAVLLLGEGLNALQLGQRSGAGALIAQGTALALVTPVFVVRLVAGLRRPTALARS